MSISNRKSMSFLDYKINYNRCLGSGVFGTVYEVVPRPENEKGYISYWMPYVYDYIFRVDASFSQPSQYCVKISKSSIRMIYENPDHPFRFKLPLHSFFEPAKEEKTNSVLRKNNFSNICFFKTRSLYSQFKTLVKGKTLRENLRNGIFLAPDQFEMRQKFVEFMRFIKNPKFTFWDLNENNIMYDEVQKKWEIIDGIFNEVNDTELKQRDDNLNFFLFHLLQSKTIYPEINYWLDALAKVARHDEPYTLQDDRLIGESYRNPNPSKRPG